MATELSQVPLFPLNAHVLPGGRLRLRIFEARYIRMVKEACAGEHGGYIGMAMLDENGSVADNTHVLPIATLAKVIDFESLPDGLLGITVAGESCVEIASIHTETDGLRLAEIAEHHSWPPAELEPADQFLAQQLQEIYNNYPELEGSKCSESYHQADWVCMRWLELLPVQAQVKQQLLEQNSCNDALSYLRELVKESVET